MVAGRRGKAVQPGLSERRRRRAAQGGNSLPNRKSEPTNHTKQSLLVFMVALPVTPVPEVGVATAGSKGTSEVLVRQRKRTFHGCRFLRPIK